MLRILGFCLFVCLLKCQGASDDQADLETAQKVNGLGPWALALEVIEY